MNHIRRAIDKINAIPQIYAFLFFEILIAVRVYAEFGRENPLTIAVFQLFWFTSVLIYFFAFFKWMLKLKDEDLTFFALGGFLPMIPVLFAFVVDRELTLNFVEPTSFLAVLKNIFTLEAAHSYNWALFPELLALLLLSFEAGWLISGKPLKSALAAFLATASSFLLLGFSWITVDPEHPSLLLLRSGLKNHQNYTLYYVSVFIIFSCIAFKDQLFDFIKCFKRKQLFAVLFLLGVLVDFAAFLCFGIDFTAYDLVVNFLPALALVSMIPLIKSKSYKLAFLFGWGVLGSLTILFFPPPH